MSRAVHVQQTTCHPHCAELLGEYVAFLRDFRGLAQSTLNIRQQYVSAFLFTGLYHRCTVADLVELRPSVIHEHVIARGKVLSRAGRKQLVSSLRSFLRFLQIKSYIKDDLTAAVPVIPIAKLDRLPRGISWEDVQKVLAVPDRQTLAGRRDYAVLLLTATYGVRIGQIRCLDLKDIDWERRVISFQPGKKGKALSFPLQAAVAEALLEYLRDDRGSTNSSRVFLTIKGPRHPLSPRDVLNASLRRLFRRAGVDTPAKGTHAIRHAFATRLAQLGTPLKTISDLLGHRSNESTFIYTKVDLPRLRGLADEWPKEDR